MIRLIPYEDRYIKEFRQLNLEWLDKYHLTESHDLEILDDPRGTILERGGFIFLVVVTDEVSSGASSGGALLGASGDEVIGSAALIPEGDGCFELAKMSVSPPYRGKGISKLLMEKCLEAARLAGAKKIILYSNSQLQTAIRLYLQYGFQHVPVTDAPFVTADVKMELQF